MRKGIHSLYNLIKTSCEFSALNGDAFVFIGVSCKSIKILRWQKDGFILYQKKLELGLYTIPVRIGTNPFFELNSIDFNRLLSSVKYRSIGGELKLEYLTLPAHKVGKLNFLNFNYYGNQTL